MTLKTHHCVKTVFHYDYKPFFRNVFKLLLNFVLKTGIKFVTKLIKNNVLIFL